MNKTEVSVVLSVFNSAPTLPVTLDSVLSQEGVDLELIVINDGSTDNSHEILSAYAARDPRLIVFHQDNEGLTCALIRGCAFARGEFIARQDAGGDISLPGRFAHQLNFLRSNATTVMTACGTRVVDPEGEPISEISQNGHELDQLLQVKCPGRIGGPSHHGAVMFRKSAYQRAGGYRPAFRVAQDFDLWTRLAELGTCLATPEVFYETRISRGSITHLYREQQLQAAQAVLRCVEARRKGRDEAGILESMEAMQAPAQGWRSEKMRDAELYYFIGRMLHTKDPRRAYAYLMRALSCWPVYPRAWLGLLRLLMSTRPRLGR